jgi:pimeloyl-ACP methyl ester carboxylesterase
MSKLISKDGTVIAYEQTGVGTGMVLVDGAMGYREHYGGRELAAALSKHFTVITYDRRGRGNSHDTPPYAVEREIEDIEALINKLGGRANLYGFSSGAVLALKAAVRLAPKVARVALHEPPFNADDDETKQEMAAFTQQMAELLAAGNRGDAVAFFLGGMVPPDVLEGMRQSPEWAIMEGVAHTLAYDNAVMGDGAVPLAAAKAATMPALVLVGSGSEAFKHAAADSLAQAMPRAQRRTLPGQTTLVSPEILAPVLAEFFGAGESSPRLTPEVITHERTPR